MRYATAARSAFRNAPLYKLHKFEFSFLIAHNFLFMSVLYVNNYLRKVKAV